MTKMGSKRTHHCPKKGGPFGASPLRQPSEKHEKMRAQKKRNVRQNNASGSHTERARSVVVDGEVIVEREAVEREHQLLSAPEAATLRH
ncbi:MAG: hypothetical protein Q9223_001882 [Gallowayella weberi]